MKIRNVKTGLYCNGLHPVRWNDTGKEFKSVERVRQYCDMLSRQVYFKCIKPRFAALPPELFDGWELVEQGDNPADLQYLLRNEWFWS